MPRRPISSVKPLHLEDFHEKLQNAIEVKADNLLTEDESLILSPIQHESPPVCASPYRTQIERMLSLGSQDSFKEEAAPRKDVLAEFCALCKSLTEDGCLCMIRKNDIVFHNLGLAIDTCKYGTLFQEKKHATGTDARKDQKHGTKDGNSSWWKPNFGRNRRND